MVALNSSVMPPFDFSEIQAVNVVERFRRVLRLAKTILQRNGFGERCSFFPPIPRKGASEEELRALESELGVALPAEYRQFLSKHRYLKLDDGLEIGGFDHEGLWVAHKPWIAPERGKGRKYLVFADYWRSAHGDHLVFDLSDSGHPVLVHRQQRGVYEPFAQSFSLALWRLVKEEERRTPATGS